MNHFAQRNLRLLNFLTFVFRFSTYEGVFVIYCALITGSFTAGMTMLAIINFTSSLFEIPTGVLSDHIGRKKTLQLYYLSNALSVLVLFVAHDFWLLALAAVLSGFATAMRSGADSAFVYENLELLGRQNEFKKTEGRRKAMVRYALVVAGLLGTVIIYWFDIRTAVGISAVVMGLGLLASFGLRDIHNFEKRKANIYTDLSAAWQQFIASASLRDISTGRMIARGLGNAEYRFRSLFFDSLMPQWLTNLLGIINNLVSGWAMQSTHWVVERLGILRSMVHYDVAERLSMLGLIALNTTPAGIAMNVITGTGYGIRSIASEDLLQQRFSKDQRATMGSLVGLGGSLVYGVMAILMGVLADQLGLIWTMVIMQLLLFSATYFFYRGITSDA